MAIDNICGGWIVADCENHGHFSFRPLPSCPSKLIMKRKCPQMPTISVTAELKALNGSCIQREQITSNDQLVGFVDSTNSQDWGLEYWDGVWVLD